jgi:hypothetical protein
MEEDCVSLAPAPEWLQAHRYLEEFDDGAVPSKSSLALRLRWYLDAAYFWRRRINSGRILGIEAVMMTTAFSTLIHYISFSQKDAIIFFKREKKKKGRVGGF